MHGLLVSIAGNSLSLRFYQRGVEVNGQAYLATQPSAAPPNCDRRSIFMAPAWARQLLTDLLAELWTIDHTTLQATVFEDIIERHYGPGTLRDYAKFSEESAP